MKPFVKVFLPSFFVLGMGLILFAVDTFGQANTWPDYRGNMIGVSSTGGAINGGLIYCEPPISDTLPMVCYFEGADAWQEATGANQVGGDIHACGGIGTRQVTIDNFALCAGDNIHVSVDDNDITLTEGVEWNRGASNNDAAISLAAAIGALAGIDQAYVIGAGAVIYINPSVTACKLYMTESDATCTTLTQAENGTTIVHQLQFYPDRLGTGDALRLRVIPGTSSSEFGFRNAADSSWASIQVAGIAVNGYVSCSQLISAGTTFYFAWSGRSRIYSDANGNIRLNNTAANDFGLLQFGGTTNAYPAWKRSGTDLYARLADDSANTSVYVGYLTADGSVAGTEFYINGDADSGLQSGGDDIIRIKVGGQNAVEYSEGIFAAGETMQQWDACTFANLGAASNGTFCYCSNCTKATPCAGAGNGALAKRLNGAWDCD